MPVGTMGGGRILTGTWPLIVVSFGLLLVRVLGMIIVLVFAFEP